MARARAYGVTFVVVCALMMSEAAHPSVAVGDASEAEISAAISHLDAAERSALMAALGRMASEEEVVPRALKAKHKEKKEGRSWAEWVTIVHRVLAILLDIGLFGSLMKGVGGLSIYSGTSPEAMLEYSKHVLQSPGPFQGVPDEDKDPMELSRKAYQGILLGARAFFCAMTGVGITYMYSFFFIPYEDMYPLFLAVAMMFLCVACNNFATIMFPMGDYIFPLPSNKAGLVGELMGVCLAGFSYYASKNNL